MIVPPSTSVVKVSAIDSTLRFRNASTRFMWRPAIKGFEKFSCGSWSFLIEHPSGRKLLFDLGMRKDWKNTAPALRLKDLPGTATVESIEVTHNVADILVEGGMKLEDIEAIVWSHHHFDHTGDASTFPSTTRLIVGPGFKDFCTPGYPTNPDAQMLDSDWEGKEIVELDFGNDNLVIGRFQALDYFGDGTLFFLNSPGHAVGHISALVRTHGSPEAGFIFMTGDSFHHIGEIRPSHLAPLPDTISPSPVPHAHPTPCPGAIFAPLLNNNSKTTSILTMFDYAAETNPDDRNRIVYIHDERDLRDTLDKTRDLDAETTVLTLAAHDWSMKGSIPEWPQDLNSWREAKIGEATHWKFLGELYPACV